MFLNIYYWEKLTFSKPVGKVHFSERNLKKCTSFEEQKSTRYIWKNLYLPLSFVYKTVTQISFKLFCSGDKKILSEFLRKWGWFQGYNECFPKYLGEKFQKTETRSCRGKSTDNNNISSCHWKILAPFCLRKKRPENAFLTLIVNYCKIVQENKLYHSKQQ